jgi:F0F1-type ATP synthase assembly protein I
MEPVPNAPKNSKPYNNYLKYGNLTVQLFAAIALAAWGGNQLDHYFGFSFPVFLLSLVLVTFTGIMVMVYRSIKNKE